MGSPLPTTMGSMACGRRCLVCFSLLLLASTVVDSGGIPPVMYNRPLRESLYPSLSSRDEKRSDLQKLRSMSMSRFGKRFDNMPDIGDDETEESRISNLYDNLPEPRNKESCDESDNLSP